jgi:hypothetical protein
LPADVPDMSALFSGPAFFCCCLRPPPMTSVGPPDHFPSVCSECLARAADMPERAPAALRFRERL